MTARHLLLLIFFLPTLLFGQNYDSVKVSEKLSGEICISCNNERKRLHLSGQQSYSKEDSLDNCKMTKYFQTDHNDIFYTKEFNLYGQLREEGFTKAVWRDRIFLGIKLKHKNYYLVKDGKWKFYNNNSNKITDCCYHNGQICSGCLWQHYDDKGNKTDSTYYYFDK